MPDLTTIAARLIAEGKRRADALSVEARRSWHMATLMGGIDGKALLIDAEAKRRRAVRLRQLCFRLAMAHGIGTNGTGRGCEPRPERTVREGWQKNTDKKEATTCAMKWQ